MNKQQFFFVGTVEVCLRGYIYNHSWIIPATCKGVAEILMEQHLEDVYSKVDEYAYSTCAVFQLDGNHIKELKQFLPLLPCKNN